MEESIVAAPAGTIHRCSSPASLVVYRAGLLDDGLPIDGTTCTVPLTAHTHSTYSTAQFHLQATHDQLG